MNISCLISEYNLVLGRCTAGTEYSNIIGDIIATPNIGLILRITPFIALFDEFSYYAYHQAVYDRGFKYIAELCWNLTNAKWVPPFLDGPVESINKALSTLTVKTRLDITPIRLRMGGESLYFLNSAQDFFVVTAPLAISTFFVLKGLYKCSHPSMLATFLRQFSTASYLATSILGDNFQYLSFRCF